MKKRYTSKILPAILLSILLSGCSSTGLFLLNSGLKLGSEHTVVKEVSYGDQPWQRLDVHVPENTEQRNRPVLIFFYGGSWDSGSKAMYYFVANSFAKRGYVVVIPDYIKYPQGKFPAFMHDGAAAIAWTHSSIAEFGGDPEQIFIAGHSAGAHLGALLMADESYLGAVGLQPDRLLGFAGLAGPYNFTPDSDKMVAIFGPPDNFPNMQINTFVSGNEPPMLLLHGAEDSTVGLLNQTSLEEKLERTGGRVETRVYPETGHVGILMSLTPPLLSRTTALDDMDRFFKAMLNDQAPGP